MQRLIVVIFLSFYSLSVSALDIYKACEERDEQKKALLSIMSTSISEAFLAGQCTGYKQTYYLGTNIVNFPQVCSKFVEKREAFLPFDMSTTLSEAAYAGMCIGAIYKVAENCGVDEQYIPYLIIAKGMKGMSESQAIVHMTAKFGCL